MARSSLAITFKRYRIVRMSYLSPSLSKRFLPMGSFSPSLTPSSPESSFYQEGFSRR